MTTNAQPRLEAAFGRPKSELTELIQIHADEAAMLRDVRTVVLRAPHVGLHALARLDERIAAHLDGLQVAGAEGFSCCAALLPDLDYAGQAAGCGEVFTLAALALETGQTPGWDRALAHGLHDVGAARGIVSALGWVSAAQLRGVVQDLLQSTHPQWVTWGLDACRLHGVNPGPALNAALAHADGRVRLAALRAAGALRRVDAMPAVHLALTDQTPAVALSAAQAACLLGDPAAARDVLARLAWSAVGKAAAAPAEDGSAPTPAPTPEALSALRNSTAAQACAWLMVCSPLLEATSWLRQLSDHLRQHSGDEAACRLRLQAMGWLGDARHIPWLIEQMALPTLARLAGEAFAMITGVDWVTDQLETLERPSTAQPGDGKPVGDEDESILLDPDDNLPWPDAERVARWWSLQGDRLRALAEAPLVGIPHGSITAQLLQGRLFMGQPITPAAVHRVLVHGMQPQRMHAARWQALLHPQEPFFNIAAPARRQRRRLSV